jgi:hypothetical protein
MKFYDIDCDGNVSYEEFIRGLRDPLSARKLAMVNRAFDLMDNDKCGKLTVKDVCGRFDVTQSKAFIEGTKTKDQILEEFLNSFDGMRGNNDGVVTKEEWIDYYTDLAVSTPTDDYFVVMMEQAWGMAENEEDAPFKDQVRQYVALLR